MMLQALVNEKIRYTIVTHYINRYNQSMKTIAPQNWRVTAAEAQKIQRQVASQVSKVGESGTPHFIAGADISVKRWKNEATAALVVLSYPEMLPIETEVVTGKIEFPYIPGLLSFREAPLILEAYNKLHIIPDLLMVDGQGIAHPRRLGIASHLGILLDIPTIGCAKSRLCGECELPGATSGSISELKDGKETIGAVVRTKNNVKPLYISIGHRIDLPGAVHRVLECCRGYRLPEPTRLAHLAAGGHLTPAKMVKYR